MGCAICQWTGWVCENHMMKAWADMLEVGDFAKACACGAGAPCICNPLHRAYGQAD